MALFSNLYALKLQRLEKILRQTRGPKSAGMAKLWQFRQGHPKPAFSVKEQKGGRREILISVKILNSGFWKAKILKSDKIYNSGFWKGKILKSAKILN